MSQMLASDLQNPEFSGATNPDSLLHVIFYSKPVKQVFLSEQEKRPIFKDIDFIKIFTPGNQLNIIDVPVDEEHKLRFPVHWARYQNGKQGADQSTGTPLAQWPRLTPAQAEELRALKFFTVEQIAGASDERIGQIGMCAGMSPLAFREKAKQFLDVAKGDAAFDRQKEELKKRDDVIAAMQKQIEELAANQKKAPGRPPRADTMQE